jgi:hypothetical protein
VDLNRLNGISLRPAAARQKLETLHFVVKPNSFFTVLVFNNVLRGAEFGSAMALIPKSSTNLPAALSASLDQLVVEKLPSGKAFDLAVRDGKTGFVFFNIEGNLYDYDANAQLLSITGDDSSFQKSLPTPLGGPQKLVRSLEKSLSERRCNQSRSPRGARLRWCRGAMLLLGTCPIWRNSGAPAPRSAWRWQQTRVTTAINQLTGFRCQTTITQSFRKISIE